MSRLLRYAGQAVFFIGCAAIVAFLSSRPIYRQLAIDQAQIKLAFRHGGVQVDDCRKPTAEELSKLPSNQRSAGNCARERMPVTIQLTLDGTIIYEALLQPTGLSRDMPSEAYEKFIVPAGLHVIEAKLRDSKRTEGYDYSNRYEVELVPWQNLAVDFKAHQGGFLFR